MGLGGAMGGSGGVPPQRCPHPIMQEKLKPAYLEQLPGKLRELSRFLGSQPWFVGGKVGAGGGGGSLGGVRSCADPAAPPPSADLR